MTQIPCLALLSHQLFIALTPSHNKPNNKAFFTDKPGLLKLDSRHEITLFQVNLSNLAEWTKYHDPIKFPNFQFPMLSVKKWWTIFGVQGSEPENITIEPIGKLLDTIFIRFWNLQNLGSCCIDLMDITHI